MPAKERTAKVSRNPDLIRGVEKPPKFYPAEDVKKPLANRRKPKPTKLRYVMETPSLDELLDCHIKLDVMFLMSDHPYDLYSRSSISPGTVLIILAGPFKINGVPLRRVNQSYVIGTSTKVGISGVSLDKFDDKYFGKVAEKKNKKGEVEFFEAEKEEKKEIPQGKKDDQKAVDAALIKAIEAVPELKTYLGARFSLKQGMKPHELVF
ncbi:hypothetical protein DY000_02063863 [Brassica cretica]|uniref:Ribosomal protein L6 N-terminal domain-containing protein n=1 Tax=Brassica cretica TaxID=69181 RepID=A0ABQ7AP60_BRACR|nr:hypothetical protein DY000_02063863 [Brassica cretica]